MKIKIFILCILIFCTSCNMQPDLLKKANAAFAGNHDIKKLNPKNTADYKLHGSFFLGIGNIDGGIEYKDDVSFCWKGNDGSYRFTKINLSILKIKIDSTDKPYVTFQIKPFLPLSNCDYDSDCYFHESIDYVILHCNENSFKEDIQINNLK